jgi:hypothetical protein
MKIFKFLLAVGTVFLCKLQWLKCVQMALMWQEIHANYALMVSTLAVKLATLTQMDLTPLAKGN